MTSRRRADRRPKSETAGVEPAVSNQSTLFSRQKALTFRRRIVRTDNTLSPKNQNAQVKNAQNIEILTLDRFAPGMRAHARTCPETLERALTRPWRDDRHFVAYAPAEVAGEYVRLTTRDGADRETGEPIPCVWSLPAGERPSVAMQLLIGDVDPPGHEWDDAWGARVAKRLARSGMAHYRTRNGYRVIVPLAEPIPLESESDAAEWSELYLAWVASVRERYGIELDPACKDWTRLYRLPNVRRDGHDERAEVIGELAPMPASELGALIEAMGTATPPAATKAPRKRTTAASEALDRAHALASVLAPSVAGHGGDAALFAATNEIATVLGADEGAIYAVLSETFNPRCVPPWEPSKLRLEARRAAHRMADPIHAIKHRALKRAASRTRSEGDDAPDDAFRLAEGEGSDEGPSGGRILLKSRRDGTVLIYESDETGYAPVAKDALRRRIIELNYEHMIPVIGPKGNAVPLDTILLEAETYAKTRYSYAPRSTYDRETHTVTLGLRAPKIAGVYDARVDAWLRAMGGDHYDRLAQWLASCHPRHVSEGRLAAALILVGPKSLGKSLLATSLAQLWGSVAAPPMRLLKAQFNAAMLDCPVLVDEESQLLGSREFSSKEFREAIQSRSRQVEPKGKERCDLLGAQRYIVPCNAFTDIRLTDLSSVDVVHAVADRILVLNLKGRSKIIRDALGALLDGPEADVRAIVGHLAWLGETVALGDDRFVGCGGDRDEALYAEASDQHERLFAELDRACSDPSVVTFDKSERYIYVRPVELADRCNAVRDGGKALDSRAVAEALGVALVKRTLADFKIGDSIKPSKCLKLDLTTLRKLGYAFARPVAGQDGGGAKVLSFSERFKRVRVAEQ